MDGINHPADTRQTQGQLQVPLADDAVLQHLELAIKTGGREALSPGKPMTQQLGIPQGQILIR